MAMLQTPWMLFSLLLITCAGNAAASLHQVSSCFNYGACAGLALSCPDSSSIYITSARYGFRYNTTSCPGREGCSDPCCQADSEACFRPYSTSDLAALYTSGGCWGNGQCVARPGWQVGGCQGANNSHYYGYISCFATLTYACIQGSQMVDFTQTKKVTGSEVAVRYNAAVDRPLPDDVTYYCRVEARDCTRRAADVMILKESNANRGDCSSVGVGPGVGEGVGVRGWLPCYRRSLSYDVSRETTPFSLYLRLVATNSMPGAWAVVTASGDTDLVVTCGYALNGDTSGGHCNAETTTSSPPVIPTAVTQPPSVASTSPATTAATGTTTTSSSTTTTETTSTPEGRSTANPITSSGRRTNTAASTTARMGTSTSDATLSETTAATVSSVTTNGTATTMSTSPTSPDNSSTTPGSTSSSTTSAQENSTATVAVTGTTQGGGGGVVNPPNGTAQPNSSSSTPPPGAQNQTSGGTSSATTIIVVVVLVLVFLLILTVVVFAVCRMGQRNFSSPRTESVATLEDELSDVVPMSVLQALAASRPPPSLGGARVAGSAPNHSLGDIASRAGSGANHSHGDTRFDTSSGANQRQGHLINTRSRSHSTRHPVQTRVRIITDSDHVHKAANRRSVPDRVTGYPRNSSDYDHLRGQRSRPEKESANLYAHLGSSLDDDVTEDDYDCLSRDRVDVIDSPYSALPIAAAATKQNAAPNGKPRKARSAGSEMPRNHDEGDPTLLQAPVDDVYGKSAEGYDTLTKYRGDVTSSACDAPGVVGGWDPPSYNMAVAEVGGERCVSENTYSLAQNVDCEEDAGEGDDEDKDIYSLCKDPPSQYDYESDPGAFIDDEQIFGGFEDVRSVISTPKKAPRPKKPSNPYVNVEQLKTAVTAGSTPKRSQDLTYLETDQTYSLAKPIQPSEENVWRREFTPRDVSSADPDTVYSLAGPMDVPVEPSTEDSCSCSPGSSSEEPDYYNTVALAKSLIQAAPGKEGHEEAGSGSAGTEDTADGSEEVSGACSPRLQVSSPPTLVSRLVHEFEQVAQPGGSSPDASSAGSRSQSPVGFSSPRMNRRAWSPAAVQPLFPTFSGQQQPRVSKSLPRPNLGDASWSLDRGTVDASAQILDPATFVTSTLPRKYCKGTKPKILYPKPAVLKPKPRLAQPDPMKSTSSSDSTSSDPLEDPSSPQDTPDYLELVSEFGPSVPRRARAMRRHHRNSDPTCDFTREAGVTSSENAYDVTYERRFSTAHNQSRGPVYDVARAQEPIEGGEGQGGKGGGGGGESMYEMERPVSGERPGDREKCGQTQESVYELAGRLDQ